MSIYLLHGKNEFLRSEAQQKAIAASKVPEDMLAFNSETLTAPVSYQQLRASSSVIPFLGDKRVVIVRDMLVSVKGDAAREVADFLPSIPPTTHLIFVEGQALPKNHIVLKALDDMGANIKRFDEPDSRDLPGWIRSRAKHHNVEIDSRAASLLAQNLGGNLRLLDQEIQKLMLYCGNRSRISAEDVQVMVPYVQSADVMFNMVDAVATRNARSAATYLHRMLDTGSHALGLFGMIVRQFRLLIQARWLRENYVPRNELKDILKVHPYVAGKVYDQAQRFSMQALRNAYDLLLDYDLSIKTGKITPEAALDLLIVQLASL